jgi:uncharacterized membrane protein YoaK (UPF0700 family)
LPLLLYILTVVTGMVDAMSFLGLGEVFVANMTGNLVLLGFAAVAPSGLSAPRHLLALFAFLLGAGIGGRLGLVAGGHRARLLAIGVSAKIPLVLGALAVAALSRGGETREDLLILLVALSMGVQNAIVRRLAVADITTTVMTSIVTAFASDIGGGAAKPRAQLRRAASVGLLVAGALLGAWLQRAGGFVAVMSVNLALLIVVCGAAWALSRSKARWAAT